MSGVSQKTVGADDGDMRFDRWFHREFPHVGHGRLSKLLRTGQIRLDGKRCKVSDRIQPGQVVRLPPLGETENKPAPRNRMSWTPTAGDLDDIASCIIHRDEHVLVLDKPAGLAVQGGTATEKHLDAMLDGLCFELPDRPRLVHRLDRDTSGVLLLARTAKAARALGASFKGRDAQKVYWALVTGCPIPREGDINLPLAKLGGPGGERVQVDQENGLPARTQYRVIESAADQAAWLELRPLTGRTHQLRAHCVALGHPILGDGKYGGREAFLDGAEIIKRLHLHARSIRLPHPAGGMLEAVAPLPRDLRQSWKYLGFNPGEAE